MSHLHSGASIDIHPAEDTYVMRQQSADLLSPTHVQMLKGRMDALGVSLGRSGAPMLYASQPDSQTADAFPSSSPQRLPSGLLHHQHHHNHHRSGYSGGYNTGVPAASKPHGASDDAVQLSALHHSLGSGPISPLPIGRQTAAPQPIPTAGSRSLQPGELARQDSRGRVTVGPHSYGDGFLGLGENLESTKTNLSPDLLPLLKEIWNR